MNSREAFEKWAERQGFSISRMRTRRDLYTEWDTDILWECWKAATERAASICAAKGDASNVAYAGQGCENAARSIREGND